MDMFTTYANQKALYQLIFSGASIFVVAANRLVERSIASLEMQESQVIVRSDSGQIGRVTRRCIVYDKDDQMIAQLIVYGDYTIECFRFDQPPDEEIPALIVQGKKGMDPLPIMGLIAASLLLSQEAPQH